jgi:hypothetical protein
MNSNFSIHDFSAHLFWDTNKELLDFDKSKSQIVFQVVEYGLMSDWNLLQKIYSREELKQTAMTLRSLDKVTLSFLAHFFKVDKSEFRCYKQSQSPSGFWNS